MALLDGRLRMDYMVSFLIFLCATVGGKPLQIPMPNAMHSMSFHQLPNDPLPFLREQI